ncbi:BT4734/BF3469 family protein [Aeromonas sp. Y318-3]|uniref:BT4734/BF3469 family protein n=1 Tax=Aeromonas sp. Y318-3 TaxID=2990509 RepID=UPI0022E1EC6F|nr:BT4734/BF3469 family protein [Aeromonas sp. Y318-3]
MKITLKKHKHATDLSIHDLETVINCIRAGGLGLDTHIESIRQLRAKGRKKEADAIKGELPAMLMGEYEDLTGGVAQDKAMAHNGIMVMDVDNIGQTVAEELRQLILNSRVASYIAFTFISPSGGLKVGLMTDYRKQEPEWYQYCYKKIFKLFVNLGAPEQELDKSTCNFNRLTYLSYDPDATFNPKPSTLSLKRWQAEFDAIAANEQRLMEQRRIASQSGSYNEHRARAYCDKAVDAIIAGLGAGNRHNGAFKICMTAFKCGLTVEDAADYLMLAKSRGQYTESISPRAKAIDAYKSFDGIVDSRFNDLSLDDVRTCAAKSLASILANHGSA